ncbi:hypothetical protein RRG08_066231 [Elysia crispata]|uniref:Uncharacterized protein n=1 Tax=Elysia crispata TaxID=231223 RepID=A0AAE1BDP0_9GAST|nr:hypothetical protein RRG08_066231 [Elysia crispata]
MPVLLGCKDSPTAELCNCACSSKKLPIISGRSDMLYKLLPDKHEAHYHSDMLQNIRHSFLKMVPSL